VHNIINDVLADAEIEATRKLEGYLYNRSDSLYPLCGELSARDSELYLLHAGFGQCCLDV
jgi:hypothetical protein